MSPASTGETALVGGSYSAMIRNQVGFAIVSRRAAKSASPETNRGSNNALSKLIRTRMAEMDLSFAEVGRRGDIPSNSVWRLATKTTHLQPPRAQTLERLARGLSLPLDVVRAAAAEAAGYRLEEITAPIDAAEDVRIVAAAMGEMTPADRAKLRKMAQMFVDGSG